MSLSTPHQQHEENVFRAALAASPDDVAEARVFADWRQENVGDDDPLATVARSVSSNRLFLRLWAEVPAAYEAQVAAFHRYRSESPEIFADVPEPPALEAVWRSFSQEQWTALESLHEPTLVLVPPLDFAHCATLLDRHPHTSNEIQTDNGAIYRDHPHPAPKLWQAFLVEGEQNMPKPDQAILRQTLGQRLAAEEEARPPHVQGIDRYLYAWLMLAGLERSAVPEEQRDSATRTLLNADRAWQESDHSRVPGAYFHPRDRQVRFFLRYADVDDSGARLRRAVGGDVA